MMRTGQTTSAAAEMYENFFIPALFGEWPPKLVDRLALEPGMRAVDVACGTGILTVEVAGAVSPGGEVVGIDLNPRMLNIARRKVPGIDWREAPAERLPLPDSAFDAVFCQFGLMFFDDRRTSLSEMWRVLKPGGRVCVAVWDALEKTPGYASVTAHVADMFGEQFAEPLRLPYSLGDPALVRAEFTEAGIEDCVVERARGRARFDSVRSWMETEIRGWSLSRSITDARFDELVERVSTDLAEYTRPDGTLEFDHGALVATATRTASTG